MENNIKQNSNTNNNNNNNNINWAKILLRTLTWEKITLFWILLVVTYFICFITINPPPPPDIEYFGLIIELIEKLVSWIGMPLVSGTVIGVAGNKIVSNFSNSSNSNSSNNINNKK